MKGIAWLSAIESRARVKSYVDHVRVERLRQQREAVDQVDLEDWLFTLV